MDLSFDTQGMKPNILIGNIYTRDEQILLF